MNNGYGEEDEEPAMAVSMGEKKNHGWICLALFVPSV